MANNNRFGENGKGLFATGAATVATEKHDRAEVGRRIKRLRQAQDITVQELAKRSEVSAGYLSEVERGLPAVSIEKLRQIAEGLGIGLDTLLGESEADVSADHVVQIPTTLSEVAERLNLSHRTTLTLLNGQRSLMARRSQRERGEWSVEDWQKFYEQVKDYLTDQ
jgi:DNA-binding XRE family transcriptional regulator